MTQVVLYIVGAQNSGSTLLEAFVGSSPRCYGLGEVGRLHNFREHPICHCGQRAFGCRVCAALLRDLEHDGGLSAIEHWFPKALKEVRLGRFLLDRRWSRAYAESADRIYRSVFAHTGAELLVDSSKNVSRAIALAQHSDFDVRFLHLVRDCRGYVNSRNAASRRQRLGTKHQFVFNIVKWIAKNLLVTVALRPLLKHNYLLFRYEDFVTDPAGSLERISRFAGVDLGSMEELLAHHRDAGRRHIFESPRAIDYRQVTLEPERLASQAFPFTRNLRFFLCGGFLSYIWGYGFDQDYLRRIRV